MHWCSVVMAFDSCFPLAVNLHRTPTSTDNAHEDAGKGKQNEAIARLNLMTLRIPDSTGAMTRAQFILLYYAMTLKCGCKWLCLARVPEVVPAFIISYLTAQQGCSLEGDSTRRGWKFLESVRFLLIADPCGTSADRA